MVPARPLLALTIAVLAAHWLALRPENEAVAPTIVHSPAFFTRTLAVKPPTPEVREPLASITPQPIQRPRTADITPGRPIRTVSAALDLKAPHPAADGPGDAAPAPSPAVQPPGAQPGPVVVPGSVRLGYQVEIRRGSLTLDARSELYWRHDGDNYEAWLEVRAPLLRTRKQHSTGRITAEGLAPLRFSDKNRGEEAAHFDRDQGKLSFSTNRPDTALLPGAQDRLSVLMQLGAMLAGAPAKFPPGTRITLQTAGTRDAEPWEFTVRAHEPLELPGGKLDAVKLTRSPRREYDVKVELWLAPGMDYVPVRLRLTQPNGDSVDQQWSSTDRG